MTFLCNNIARQSIILHCNVNAETYTAITNKQYNCTKSLFVPFLIEINMHSFLISLSHTIFDKYLTQIWKIFCYYKM